MPLCLAVDLARHDMQPARHTPTPQEKGKAHAATSETHIVTVP